MSGAPADGEPPQPDGQAASGGVQRLWAGWRTGYIEGRFEPPAGRGSLFERLLAVDDDRAAYVLWRGERCSVVLNAYPYTSGHLMVLPNEAHRELDTLDDATHHELWELVRSGVMAVRDAYRPQGVNVGLNLGEAAGAGVPDHLHVHVLPRWAGDTNFMTAVAETRVLPEPLDRSWEKLRAAWPH